MSYDPTEEYLSVKLQLERYISALHIPAPEVKGGHS